MKGPAGQHINVPPEWAKAVLTIIARSLEHLDTLFNSRSRISLVIGGKKVMFTPKFLSVGIRVFLIASRRALGFG